LSVRVPDVVPTQFSVAPTSGSCRVLTTLPVTRCAEVIIGSKENSMAMHRAISCYCLTL
jgi:hypothetical protein